MIKNRMAFFLLAITSFSFISKGDVTLKQKVTTSQGGKAFSLEGTAYFQGKNMRMDLKPVSGKGSSPMGEMMVLSIPSGNYTCMAQNKMCNKMSGAFSPLSGQMPSPTKSNRTNSVSISKTGKKDKIAGFECVYYTVIREDSKSESCYSSAARATFSEEMLNTGKAGIAKEEWDLGIPLKSEYQLKEDSGGDKVISEVVSLKSGSVAASLFQIPSGYQTMDVGAMMGSQGSQKSGMPAGALKQLKQLQKNGDIPPEVLKQMKNMMPSGE